MRVVEQLAPIHGVTATCAAFGITRNALYRARRRNAAHGQPAPADGPLPLLPPPAAEPTAAVASLPEPGPSTAEPTTVPIPLPEPTRSPSPRALSTEERVVVRDVLNSERFQDCAPREVYATLLDEEVYHCSWRTMYRILAAHQEVRERRNQLRHPAYVRPELLTTRPNQLWSWDITKLRGPATDLPSADEDAWPLSSVAPSPSLSREDAGVSLRPVKGRVNLPRPQFGRGRLTRFISTLDGAAVTGYTPVSDGEGAPTEAGPCAS